MVRRGSAGARCGGPLTMGPAKGGEGRGPRSCVVTASVAVVTGSRGPGGRVHPHRTAGRRQDRRASVVS